MQKLLLRNLQHISDKLTKIQRVNLHYVDLVL